MNNSPTDASFHSLFRLTVAGTHMQHGGVRLLVLCMCAVAECNLEYGQFDYSTTSCLLQHNEQGRKCDQSGCSTLKIDENGHTSRESMKGKAYVPP
uniref:Secreted protein n=1 Tax=Peronospora matthiolae TaxID=2874970 RepID=A0AAV1V262_9STRA